MGLYYKLSNGEEIEIKIENTEDYTKELQISLFNGSTTLIYPINNILSLNEIITDVEAKYNKLLIEDKIFEYSCWCN